MCKQTWSNFRILHFREKINFKWQKCRPESRIKHFSKISCTLNYEIVMSCNKKCLPRWNNNMRLPMSFIFYDHYLQLKRRTLVANLLNTLRLWIPSYLLFGKWPRVLWSLQFEINDRKTLISLAQSRNVTCVWLWIGKWLFP